VKTVPGVREAIEQKNYDEANQEIVRVAKALQDESALIESAAQAVGKRRTLGGLPDSIIGGLLRSF